ncbi:DsrE family protein [Zwartia sp.]|uniref:DsrE family protein n=1 Tax=Zwartia sp. TaxID=2978004 RepID=UPI003BB15B8D
MKKSLFSLCISIVLGLTSAPIFAQKAYTPEPNKVVYHVDDAEAQGLKGLRNIRNHLDVAPSTKITVVMHANGVDLVMDGAQDKKSKAEYAPLVSALVSRGVVFEVCEITLKNRNLKKDQFVLEATFTPSGVARLADLQAQQKFAYIKP